MPSDADGCLECGSPETSTCDLEGAVVDLSFCPNCQLTFQSTWSTAFQPELYDYYLERLDWPAGKLFPQINSTRHAEQLGDLAASVGRQRRLLDVGCGSGGFVRSAKALGWSAEGIDLSAPAIRLARQHDIPCHHLDFFDSSLDERRFDVIVMSELLEHVPQPSTFVQRAAELLARDGALYLTTPNWNSLSRRVLQGDWRVVHPEHLSYFTPESLRLCAEKGGLGVESIHTANVSLTTLRRLLRMATAPDPERADEQVFRVGLEASPTSRIAKRSLNRMLDLLSMGDTMKAVLKPE